MFFRAMRRAAPQGVRNMSTKKTSVNGPGNLDGIYRTLMKNNMTYVTTILVAAVVAEGVYGGVTDYVWETANRGRLYHHIDWSQFKTEDDEDEDEDEDDE